MRSVLAAVAVTVVLSACGTDGDDTATDPADSTSPSVSQSATASPEAPPTVGTYPSYEPDDYRFTLRISCFCAGAGSPIRVTVVDDEVTEAVYAEDGRGVHRGDEVEDHQKVTIDDVIDAANDTDAASVTVKWPAGQDHPDSVHVDKTERTVDEEVGYAISGVVVG
jgi:hypothetical protein